MLKSLRDLYVKIRDKCRESKKAQIDIKIDYPDLFKPEGLSQTSLDPSNIEIDQQLNREIDATIGELIDKNR